jgi:hypothetical protein
MKDDNFSDEELLSYLLGDGESELRESIQRRLKLDSKLRERLEAIAFIRGEVKNAPISFQSRSKKVNVIGRFSRGLVLASVLFGVGVFTGLNIEFSSEVNKDVLEIEREASAPLSWDESKFLSLM